MTVFEMIVVVVGLLAGWFGISAAFNRAAARNLRTLASRSFSNEDLDNTWPKLLQVNRSADIEAVDAAWERRCAELRKCFPAMMTETESGEFEQAFAILSRARDSAHRQISSGQLGRDSR